MVYYGILYYIVLYYINITLINIIWYIISYNIPYSVNLCFTLYVSGFVVWGLGLWNSKGRIKSQLLDFERGCFGNSFMGTKNT